MRFLLCALAGLGTGFVGTFVHRMGALYNVPYGLILALLMVVLSAWSSRLRSGAMGVGVHLIVCSLTVWILAAYAAGGDVLVPIGFGGQVPFFSQHAGYMWLYGVIVVHMLVVLAPRRLIYGVRSVSSPTISGTSESKQAGTR